MDKWLSNTNVVRIIALVLSVMLWGIVHMEQMNGGTSAVPSGVRDDKINDVSITPIYDSSQYLISSIEPSKVTVLLTGKDSALRKVSTASYQIVLDLTNVTEGEHNLPLRAAGFPSGVQVQIIPSTVKVTLEKQERKEVPVVINVKGTPGVGLKAGQPIVKPNKVNVTLPASRLNDVENVFGEINVDKATSAVSKQVKLKALDKNGREVAIDITPAVVDVEVPITSPFKTIPLQLKYVGEPAKGYSVASVTPEKDKVTVYGTQADVDKIDFYQGPDIDLTGFTESKDITITMPLRGNITQVDPPVLRLHVEIAPTASKAVENVPLTIIGQNDMYDTKIAAPESGRVNLLLEGAPAILDGLKPQDVQAIVDVSNLPPGKHDVPITLNLPQFVRRGTMPELRATVDITAKPGTDPSGGAAGGAGSPAASAAGGQAQAGTGQAPPAGQQRASAGSAGNTP
ncbi:CdaR family protein [Gordoniibacillus kamchatkensis]|uniref:CdaR family protein n=1 Tax=Gordoniibacillus kamchatkensis TaxID=1590651 RepID=UPI0009E58EEA|nr:CdaR family protein [Paenibacillus sp. VKM B-2647]